jgi:FkbM family methyltransferase
LLTNSISQYAMNVARKRGLHIRLARAARRYGLDIRKSSKHPDLVDFINDRNIDVVFDVGANAGQFGQKLRGFGYKGTIISYEPILSAFKHLEQIAKSDNKWTAHNFAIGAESGQLKINLSANSKFNSALDLRDNAEEFHGGVVTDGVESVPVWTLDRVAAEYAGNILIKIDTQGLERQVIEGGKKTVARSKAVLMELPIIALYNNSWRLSEAIEYMDGLGFVPTQIHPVNYHPTDRQALVEIDCLFRRRDQRLD